MTRIELASGVADDLDRILNHLIEHDAAGIESRLADISQALEVLARNPKLGRPLGRDLRELVIGSGPRGYLALYRHLPASGLVLVHAIRAQREAGYAERND